MIQVRKLNFKTSIDRLFMLLSKSKFIDGLWIGVLNANASNLCILTNALELIKSYDPMRYRRLTLDLRRIWLTLLVGGVGEYDQLTATCKIDERYASRNSAAAVALVIVHEATHARLRQFGYPENQRQRIEKICIRRELAFAKMLPGCEVLVEWVEGRLANPGDYSPAELELDRKLGELQAAQEFGVPLWIVSTAHWFRDGRAKG